MVDLVINERRRETRIAPTAYGESTEPHVPGARILEVVDTSARGLRCRLAHPVRPGRTMPLRLPSPHGHGLIVFTAFVVRCEVCRLTRHGVQYEAAWSLETPWRP